MKENWTYKKLGEVAEITSGYTPKATELSSKGDFPYFKISDMNTEGNEMWLSKSTQFASLKKHYPQGAIVFPKNGAAIATNKKRILAQESIVDLNTGICTFTGNINTLMAFYWFLSLDFRDYTRGGALPTLDIKALKMLPFPVPSFSEQEAIVRELDLLNDILSKKRAQLKEYDALQQSLFYTMFGDPVTNEKGWEVKKFDEFASATTGITYTPDDVSDQGIIVLRSSNIQENRLDFEDIVRVKKELKEKYIAKDGDILMCSRNGSFRLVGKTAIITGLQEEMTWGAFMTVIRSNSNPYLLQYFRTPAFREQLVTAKTTTVNQITIGMLNALSIPLPPLPLQQEFAKKVEAIEELKAKVNDSIRETENLLASRMDYYFG